MDLHSIDLRSDTITQPTPAMREAMATAAVGDDVFGEDPTVCLLQQRVADLLGTESGLFVPSGTMANQIAILVHCSQGDTVIAGEGAHSFLYESGGGAALGGVQFTIAGNGGLYTAQQAAELIHPEDHHFSPTTLLMAENSHNRGGGRVFPLDELKALRMLADEKGLAFHIDGARLFNAAIASGTPPQEYGKIAHSLSVCLSKGLGAPVGSVIAGSERFIDQAHRFRKMLGGGMRQVGIIAAGGLFALENHIDRLETDHRHAHQFAKGIEAIDGLSIDTSTVETNIVIFETSSPELVASRLVDAANELGLRMFDLNTTQIRAVFHLHITEEDVADGITRLGRAVENAGHSG